MDASFVFRTRDGLYTLINSISAVLMALCMLQTVKKKTALLSCLWDKKLKKLRPGPRLTKKRLHSAAAETLLLTAAAMVLAKVSSSAWADFANSGKANYFGILYFTGPVFALLCWLVKAPGLAQLDLFTPAFVVNLAAGKVACFVHGCCYGKELSHSFYYSTLRSRYEVPVQLLELTAALLILAVVVLWLQKAKSPGYAFPLFTLLYSVTRFCTEFFRDDYPVISGSLTAYHLQCIAGAVLGLAEIGLLTLYYKRKTAKTKK